jgi:hypothetical protein
MKKAQALSSRPQSSTRIFAFRIHQPGVEAAEVFAVEQEDSLSRTSKRRNTFVSAGNYCREPEIP